MNEGENIVNEKQKALLLAMIAGKYPHVADQMELLWGGKEFDEYIHTILIMDTRDGQRQGFEFTVFTKIVELAELHNKMCKTRTKRLIFDNKAEPTVIITANGIDFT